MTLQFTTLADDLDALGVAHNPAGYQCTCTNPVTGRTCRYVGMAGEFANVGAFPVIDRDYVCGGCAADLVMQAQAMARLMVGLSQPAPWDSEEGNAARAKRNLLIAQAREVADPLTSPYDADTQAAYAERIRLLNRVTVDYERPGLVDWGVEPPRVFA